MQKDEANEHSEHHRHQHEHHVKLAIQAASGYYSHDFASHDTLRHVVETAVHHLHLTLPAGETWELRHGDRRLNLDETIHQAQLHGGENLTLAPHEHRLHLTILTLSGNYSHDFKASDSLQHVVDETVKHTHIVLPPGEVWELRHGERLLKLDETVRDAHLHSGDKLKLAPHEGGGG